jgi:hypothetical protein
MTQKGNVRAAYEGILVISQQPTTVISETTRNVINQEINQNTRVDSDDDGNGGNGDKTDGNGRDPKEPPIKCKDQYTGPIDPVTGCRTPDPNLGGIIKPGVGDKAWDPDCVGPCLHGEDGDAIDNPGVDPVQGDTNTNPDPPETGTDGEDPDRRIANPQCGKVYKEKVRARKTR